MQGNSATIPGGDAGVVRVEGTQKALAMSADVTPRYCEADPFEGGKQAVAEAWRNITAVGADPIAITDNLNFGNPEKPEIMGQFVMAVKGLGEACRALDFPIVSGNVSLYNETNGRGILPTPAIVGVGLIPDVGTMATLRLKAAGEAILLVGDDGRHMGQTLYLREILGREEGHPPSVDLDVERRNGDFVRGLIRGGSVTACHDLSDGGLGVALAEMAIAGGLGADVAPTAPPRTWHSLQRIRRAISLPSPPTRWPRSSWRRARPASRHVGIGTVGGDRCEARCVRVAARLSLDELSRAHEGWFPQFMGGPMA